ncbi:HK97 gp10 family phage protein [Nonomuraea mesophila]|uniref:HK97 gp10 family phage protein n=1 Tax=Nonomuraea mesophila TaxID=2530382 RepID=A0A4R5EZD1_9ACTN|nr:HK97 gp10 family phage protein [Nonomuraea mesophila]TDE40498.1 HK97 gp10 family phage protein [Nonomuraea mesophila]
MANGNAEIRRLIRDMKKIPPDLRKDLRPALKKAAQPILADARKRASWSTRIPKATRIAIGLASKKKGGVSLRTSAKRAPHARPYENLGNPGTFRHPVFALPRSRDMVFGYERPGAFKNTPWVAQKARPFLFPAVEAGADGVTAEIGRTVLDIARRHGWKG